MDIIKDAFITDINKELYDYYTSIPNKKRYKEFIKLKKLGQGVTSKVYSTFSKNKPEQKLVMKTSHSKYILNEFQALLYLRDKMLLGTIPHYYNFMYSNYTSKDKQKIIILERCHENLFDDVLVCRRDWGLKEYIMIFYQIADAVDILEKMEMNHGDLWSDNIMVYWKTKEIEEMDEGYDSNEETSSSKNNEASETNDDTDDSYDSEPSETSDQEYYSLSHENNEIPEIRIIDFDASFCKGVCESPNLGYSEFKRTAFYIGYDLSRLFDDLLQSHKSYMKKRSREKRKTKYRIHNNHKKGEELSKESDASDTNVKEWDFCNIQYPKEFLEWMSSLPLTDPEFPENCPEMSGHKIKQSLKQLAKKHKITF